MECENHPDENAVETCVVCGAGVCEECLRTIDGEAYCITCADEYSQEGGDLDDDEDEDEDEEDVEDFQESDELSDDY